MGWNEAAALESKGDCGNLTPKDKTSANIFHWDCQFLLMMTRGFPIGKIVVSKIVSNYSIFC